MPIDPGVVADRHFGEAGSHVLELFQHLDTEGPVGLPRLQAVDELTPKQAEVTVDIPQAQAERPPNESMVQSEYRGITDLKPLIGLTSLNGLKLFYEYST